MIDCIQKVEKAMRVGDLVTWHKGCLGQPEETGIIVELAPEGSDLAESEVVVMWSRGAEWCHIADLEVLSASG